MQQTGRSWGASAVHSVVLCVAVFSSIGASSAAEPGRASAAEAGLTEVKAGGRLYQTYCWFCHGTRGVGNGLLAHSLSPPPRNFVRAEYKLRSTDAGSIPTDRDLFLTITRGVPGTLMPGWHTLSERQRWQLVGYLKSLSRRFSVEAAPVMIPSRDPFAKDAKATVEGKKLYNEVKCWLCHGKEGSGDGPITTALVRQWGMPYLARDLLDGASYKGGSTVGDVFRTISTGFNDTPMSSHHELLTERQRWAVSHYVASLADKKLRRDEVLEDGVSWQRGRWTFFGKGRCILCHKVEGIGEGTRGPDLSKVGLVAGTRQKGKSALQYLFTSITNPTDFLVPDYPAAMPHINKECIFLSADEIRSLIVYLASQGQPNPPERSAFAELPEPPPADKANGLPAVTGDVAQGWKLFNSEKASCSKCHAVQGRGPQLAPDLTNLASIQSARQITESLLEPSKVLTAGFVPVVVSTDDGHIHTGVIVRQNESELQLADDKGNVEIISREEIDDDIMPQKLSNMPANIGTLLSEGERADLIAFLIDQRPALDDVFYLAQEHRFFDPYERTKNGPPLANVKHKVGENWLKEWLKNPQSISPHTFMPNLQLTDDEIVAITAYLTAVADADFPSYEWTEEFTKPFDDLTNEEFDRLDQQMTHGKQLWSESRCSICHRVNESGGLVGHAPELTNVARKLRRDWLNYWLDDPRYYFASSEMPHFSFSPQDRKDLVAYLLRSDDFGGMDVPKSPDEPPAIAPPPIEMIHRGHLVMERSRCHICHDIPGFEDSLFQRDDWPNPRNDFELLVRDRRCLTCHAINGRGGTYAPDLTTIGSRLKKEWIEQFLAAPDVVRPLIQQMPKMKLTPAETRAAADYAKSDLIDPTIDAQLLADFQPDAENIAAGRDLYQAKGCQACHQIGVTGGAVGPPLTAVADRLEPGYIYARLKSPQRFKPDVVEPDYGLTNSEALDLTRFLMSLSQKQQKPVSSQASGNGDQL